MFIWIREVKKRYPHIDNKDIDLVLKVNNVSKFEHGANINWHDVLVKQYLKSDIESLFWPIWDK